MNNSLKAANTLRIGGEIRHKKMSYRGGYKLEQSPILKHNLWRPDRFFSWARL